MTETLHATPHNPAAERSMLSIIWNNPEVADDFPDLSEAHFFLPPTKAVFRRLKAGLTELELMVDDLKRAGELDKIGGPAALAEILTYNSGGTKSAPAFFQNLNLYLARRLTLEAAAIMQEAAYEATTAEELDAATGSPIQAITDQLHGRIKERTAKEVIIETWNLWEARTKGEVEQGIKTSIEDFNQKFGGLQPGHTNIIAGKPGQGKSMMAMQFAFDALRNGNRTMVFTLELSDIEIMERGFSYLGHAELNTIIRPENLSRYEMEKVKRGCDAALKISDNLKIIEAAGMHLGSIVSTIRREHRKNPVRVVVLDYVQLVDGPPEMRKETKERQLSEVVTTLAKLARELKFTLLLPSQLNDDGTTKHARAINEAADLQLQIKTEKTEKESRSLGVLIAKTRHTRLEGEMMYIYLNGSFCKFSNEIPIK